MSGPFTIPNLLTAVRIAFIPAIVVLFYLPYHWSDMACGVVFALVGITDAFDGYLARKLGQVSSLGAFLDPVADKLMVAAALIVLTEKGIVDPFASLIIIGREITVSALREWMAQIGQSKSVAVNVFGKVKTVGQLVAIPFLLFNGVLFGMFHTVVVGRWLIWIAAGITLLSMVVYLKAAIAVPPEPPK